MKHNRLMSDEITLKQRRAVVFGSGQQVLRYASMGVKQWESAGMVGRAGRKGVQIAMLKRVDGGVFGAVPEWVAT